MDVEEPGSHAHTLEGRVIKTAETQRREPLGSLCGAVEGTRRRTKSEMRCKMGEQVR